MYAIRDKRQLICIHNETDKLLSKNICIYVLTVRTFLFLSSVSLGTAYAPLVSC